MKQFEVIVIGGGHAGCEASLASARMGRSTAIVTLDSTKSAVMPCNPSIGGVGKGQLVKEVDALGGEMGINADLTAIQFRQLNTRKGSAVQSSRCQSDKNKYAARMQSVLSQQPNLTIVEGEAKELCLQQGKIVGVLLELKSGERVRFTCLSLVVTTGTFMQALMHFGEETREGGRVGEKGSFGLSESLSRLGLSLIRLKTGTPPRLLAGSIDWSRLKCQPGDSEPKLFSFSETEISLPQIQCHLGFTNERTHEVIQKNLRRSPLYSGRIQGIGPRYCPSIEDKVVKFPEKGRHQVFFEPVALDSDWIYPNGVSTSLPKDVQEGFIRTIEGCESAEFAQYGYAVEYDCVDPTQLDETLQSKACIGLYLAGQVNGTSGYEEAAAQGIIAGINAALRARNEDPVILDRSQAYIGVMVDDLTTKGVSEPYRMFTSRAEFRLSIREDNADLRLRPLGYQLGLVSEEGFSRTESKRTAIEELSRQMSRTFVKPGAEVNSFLVERGTAPIRSGESLSQLLKRPELGLSDLRRLIPAFVLPDSHRVRETLEIEVKYAGYIQIQNEEINRLKTLKHTRIPSEFPYDELLGLSIELRQKLADSQPRDLAEAARIPGVTPAALTSILFSLRQGHHGRV